MSEFGGLWKQQSNQHVLKVWHNLRAFSAQWKVAAKSKEEEAGGRGKRGGRGRERRGKRKGEKGGDKEGREGEYSNSNSKT